MADFLVLEEDGTSHLELEESSSDFLAEESSPHEVSGAGVVGVASVTPPPPPPPPSSWKVGTLTVPSSTGNVSVTGLGGTPLAVFFYGTNWLTEDTAVTSTGTGLFRGMAAPKWDAPGTTLQSSASVVIAGDAHHLAGGHAINMLNTSGGVTHLYSAQLTSWDAGGFTVAFDNATAGGYKIVYVALMGSLNVGALTGMLGGTTVTLGWKAGSALMHGAWGGTEISGSDRTQEFYGGGAYPGTNNNDWESAGAVAFCFPTSGSGQYVNEITNDAPYVRVATGGHFTGPFLTTSNIVAFPTGTGLLDFIVGGDSADGGMTVAWEQEHSATRRSTPATSEDGTSTVTGLDFAPALMLGYTISNEPTGQGTGSRGALGFAVVTEAFQWCATVDGQSSRGAFQSFQRGFADTVSGTSVHAGTVELTTDGFVLTTEQDDIAPNGTLWHIFGAPPSNPWIPQIYRQLVTA